MPYPIKRWHGPILADFKARLAAIADRQGSADDAAFLRRVLAESGCFSTEALREILQES